MEALPNMIMLAPNFRSSTSCFDNSPGMDWRLNLKEYILMNFQADPHEYDWAMDRLVRMKYDANVPSPTIEQMGKLKSYYGQICMMQKRFPMSPGGAMETPFTWHDGVFDTRNSNSEVTLNDIEFEKASIMFNIGACHAQYAAEQPRDTQDSIKAAFMHFQSAAYAFEQLNTFRNSDMFYPSVDLDANVILFYYKVLMAQAQECLVQKSLLDNRSPIVIARLALWIHETLDSASKIADDWTVNVPETMQRYYERVCRYKADMYAVIGHMSLGDHYETEERKMGYRLQFYNIAAKYMEGIFANRKLRDQYPEIYITANFLNDVVTAKRTNAEKENNFIYHDIVPSVDEALTSTFKQNGPMCKVKPLAFDPLDASICGEDLFAGLLPPTVIDANKKYEAQKSELYNQITDQARAHDEQLEKALEKADFANLRFMLNEGKNAEVMYEIPEELMKRNADMTSYPDAVPNLLEKLRESSDTARVAEAKLNTLIAKLRAIDLPRLRADEGYILISKELDKLAEHLSVAKNNNLSLNKAIAAHLNNLQILSLNCQEMWQRIVPETKKKKTMDGAADGVMSQEERDIRKMVDKIVEMKSQRIKLVEQLANDLKADELSKKLMGTNDDGSEAVRNEEIAKHSKNQQLIRLNLDAQQAILKAFADANADFCEQRMAMQSARGEYEKHVRELIESYEVYRDVARKCEEGETFYRQLMSRCDQFAVPIHAMEEQYRAEVEKKELAQKEAEQRLQQFRMTRDAQNAMMDFGGPQQAFQGAPSPVPRPPGPSARAPRLGDYLDSYRARKTNQAPINQQSIQIPHHQLDQMPDEHGGPPSPTPSSVCDYPASQRGSRSVLTSPRYPPPVPQQFGAPGGQYPPYQQAPRPYQSYQPPPVAQVFQHPPQGAPISAPPQHHHQHVPQPAYQGYQQPGGAVGGQIQGYQQPGGQNLGQMTPERQIQGQVPSGGQIQSYQQPGDQNFGQMTPGGQNAPYQQPGGQNLGQMTPESQIQGQVPSGGRILGYQPSGAQIQGQQLPGAQNAPYQQPGNQIQSQVPSGGQNSPYQQPSPQNLAQQRYQQPDNQNPLQLPPGGQIPAQQPSSGYQNQNSVHLGPNSSYQHSGHQNPPYHAPPDQIPPSQNPGAQISTSIAHGHQNLSYQAPGAPVAQETSQISGYQGYGAPGAPGTGFGSSGASGPQGPPSSGFGSSGAPSSGFSASRSPSSGFGSSGAPGAQGSQGFASSPASGAPRTGYGSSGAPSSGFGSFGAPGPRGPQGFAPSSAPGAPPTHQLASQGFQPNSGAPGTPGTQNSGTPGLPPSGPVNSARQTPAPAAPAAPGAAGPPGAPIRFQPAPGAPSPWHATPAELKTPWNTAPQYHAPGAQNAPNSHLNSSPQPPQPPPSSAQLQPPTIPAQSTRSNVDLLSDLLGDFNLPPPIQPAVQNHQNFQNPPVPLPQQHPAGQQNVQQQQQDFRLAPGQMDPGGRPVGAVPPMPQQPQMTQNNGFQGGFEAGLGAPNGGGGGGAGAVETPILVKGPSFGGGPIMNMLPVTDLVDPNKFELGVGDVQKLEKRMLHHSIRTNGAPPPLNQSDPLNQIDAFSSFAMKR